MLITTSTLILNIITLITQCIECQDFHLENYVRYFNDDIAVLSVDICSESDFAAIHDSEPKIKIILPCIRGKFILSMTIITTC